MADPYRVWQGTLTREQFDQCPEAGLIEFRETPEGIYAKLVGEAPSFRGSAKVSQRSRMLILSGNINGFISI